jgi:hypothetical protein
MAETMKNAVFWDVGLVRTDILDKCVSSFFRAEIIRELGMLTIC